MGPSAAGVTGLVRLNRARHAQPGCYAGKAAEGTMSDRDVLGDRLCRRYAPSTFGAE
jgi:hypothetical protein